jgi:hypothetical protein
MKVYELIAELLKFPMCPVDVAIYEFNKPSRTF